MNLGHSDLLLDLLRLLYKPAFQAPVIFIVEFLIRAKADRANERSNQNFGSAESKMIVWQQNQDLRKVGYVGYVGNVGNVGYVGCPILKEILGYDRSMVETFCRNLLPRILKRLE